MSARSPIGANQATRGFESSERKVTANRRRLFFIGAALIGLGCLDSASDSTNPFLLLSSQQPSSVQTKQKLDNQTNSSSEYLSQSQFNQSSKNVERHDTLSEAAASPALNYTASAAYSDNSKLRICHATAKMQYYCEGAGYEEFSGNLETLVQGLTSNGAPATGNKTYSGTSNNIQSERNRYWGRRSNPSPRPNSNILFFGNSHTRQLLHTLRCQYSDQIVSYNNTVGQAKFANTEVFHLTQNVTIVGVTNHWIVYSPDWPHLLPQITGGYELEDFDAIVLGRFNDKDNTKGTNFGKWITSLNQEMAVADSSTDASTGFSMKANPPPKLKESLKYTNEPATIRRSYHPLF